MPPTQERVSPKLLGTGRYAEQLERTSSTSELRLVSCRLVRLPGLEARRERDRLWILMASDEEGFPPMYVRVTKLLLPEEDEDDCDARGAPTSEAAPEDTASKWLRRLAYSWCRSSIREDDDDDVGSEASDLAGLGLPLDLLLPLSRRAVSSPSAAVLLSLEMTMSRSRSACLRVAMASSISRPRSRWLLTLMISSPTRSLPSLKKRRRKERKLDRSSGGEGELVLSVAQ